MKLRICLMLCFATLIGSFAIKNINAYCTYHDGNPITNDELSTFIDSMILNTLGKMEDCPKKLRSDIWSHVQNTPYYHKTYSWLMECCWNRHSILNTIFSIFDDHICKKAESYLKGSYAPDYINMFLKDLRIILNSEKNKYKNCGYDLSYYAFFGGRLKDLIMSIANGTATFEQAILKTRKNQKPYNNMAPIFKACSGLLTCNMCGKNIACSNL